MSKRKQSDGRCLEILPQGKEIIPDKAQLLGFLAGDGCIAATRGRAVNTDLVLVAWLKRVIKSVYGIDPSSTTTTSGGRIIPLTDVFLCKAIVEDCHSLAPWGMHEWRVPGVVLRSDSMLIKARYLRGFFDAEGNVFVAEDLPSGPGKRHNRVAAVSVNEAGLSEIRALLNELGISSGFYITYAEVGGEKRRYFKVQVSRRSDVLKFADIVGFESPAKAMEIEKVREFPKVLRKGEIYEERLEAMESLGLTELPATKAAVVIGCSAKQVRDARRWRCLADSR